MPGISVDIETQLLIDKVVKGSNLDASVDDLLGGVNRRAKKSGVTLLNMKSFSESITIIEREYLRLTRKLMSPIKISTHLAMDDVKKQNRVYILAQQLKEMLEKQGMERSEKGWFDMAKRLLKKEDDIKRVYREREFKEKELHVKKLAEIERAEKKRVEVTLKAEQKARKVITESVFKGNLKDTLGIDTMQTGKKSSYEIGEMLPKRKGKDEPSGDFLKQFLKVIWGKDSKPKIIPESPKPIMKAVRGKESFLGPKYGGTTGKVSLVPSGRMTVPKPPSPLPGAGAGAGAAAGIGAALIPLAAVIAAAVAVGILVAAAIKKMVEESKILSMVTRSVSKAMGLLMDLILLPFLPLIALGLLYLFKGVIILGMGIGSLIQTILDWIVDIGKWTLDVIISATEELKELWKKILKGDPVAIVVGLVLGAGALAILAWLLPLLAGTATGAIAIGIAVAALSAFEMWLLGLFVISPLLAWGVMITIGIILGTAVVMLLNVLGILQAISDLGEGFRENSGKWFESLPPALQSVISFLHNGISLLGEFFNLFNRLLGLPTIMTPQEMTRLIKAKVYNADVLAAVRAKHGDISYSSDKGYTYTKTGTQLPGYAMGGIVPGMIGAPQLAVVHGGEKITPPGRGSPDSSITNRSSTQQNTFNFYGYQDDKFVAKVKDVMRQQGAQYKL